MTHLTTHFVSHVIPLTQCHWLHFSKLSSVSSRFLLVPRWQRGARARGLVCCRGTPSWRWTGRTWRTGLWRRWGHWSKMARHRSNSSWGIGRRVTTSGGTDPRRHRRGMWVHTHTQPHINTKILRFGWGVLTLVGPVENTADFLTLH